VAGKRVAVYSRQSTANDDQVEEHVRWCTERVEGQGDTLVGPFRDNGISGYKRTRRPGYEAMLVAVAAGQVDAIMAVRYDRLLRDPREGLRLTEVMDAAEIADLFFIEEGAIDLRTAAGRSEVRKRVDAATYYSDSLGEKVKASKRRIAYAGRWCGAAPYGYEAVNDHPDRRDGVNLVENPAEADVIRQALSAVKAGRSAHFIAIELRTRGLTTGWGRPWNSKALRRALLSPAIAGLAELNGEILHDVIVQWQPIINKADHELLVERLSPNHVDRHPEAANLAHPLTGFLRCGRILPGGPRAGEVCGTLMNGSSLKDGRSRYTCSTERGGCGRVGVSGKHVEPIIVKYTLAALLAEKRIPVGDGVAAEVHEAAAAELSAIARDRAKLNALADSDMFTKPELAPKFAELKRRERKAKATISRPIAVEFDARKVAATVRERWAAYQSGDRDAAALLHDEIGRVLDRIDVAPIKPGVRRNVFDPRRLTVITKIDTLEGVLSLVEGVREATA
jgi:site-specific DNA recombinase